MKVAAFDIFSYSLPLKPLKVGNKTLNRREGLIIELTNENGQVGLGEIAPLPGFSKESLKAAKAQTLRLRRNILGKIIPFKLTSGLLPSVRFGVESAIEDLLKPSKESKRIPVNAYLAGSEKTICREGKHLLKRGFTTFKVKIGHNLQTDVKKVIALRKALGKKVRLRLDAAPEPNGFDLAGTKQG